jgi:molybdopterin-guanine dinucleotide biosynthesis protein A
MGLYGGLRGCRRDWAFVTGCDMPFFDHGLFGSMAARRDDHDAVIPRVRRWYEPLFSLYHVRCLEAVEAHLDRRQIASFFGSIDALYIASEEIARFDPEMRCFFNINTEDDLRAARRIEKTLAAEPRNGGS